jgi:hypothetical protein
MFHSSFIVTYVFGSIYPFFFTMSLLDIILEFTNIFAAVYMGIFTITVCHIILEFPMVNVSFGMPENSLTFCFVILPLTFIMSSISPILYTITMPDYSWHFF